MLNFKFLLILWTFLSPFQDFDDFIFTFFAVEMVIKMVALGIFGKKCYLGDTWNRLDFFIVLAGWVILNWLDWNFPELKFMFLLNVCHSAFLSSSFFSAFKLCELGLQMCTLENIVKNLIKISFFAKHVHTFIPIMAAVNHQIMKNVKENCCTTFLMDVFAALCKRCGNVDSHCFFS